MIERKDTPKAIGRSLTGSWRQGRTLDAAGPWIIASIVTFGLYAGRSVLLPIILAILLSFLLAPIVAGFRRLRVPRAPAVLLAIVLALGAIGTTSAILISQAATLSRDAPAYAERITAKVADLRTAIHERFGSVLRSSGGSSSKTSQDSRRAGAALAARPEDSRAVPVEIREPVPSAMDEIRSYLLPALAPIETTLIVLIVAIFILFQKEDLRDRLIRIMGTADLHRTTIALDEGAKRLSRYFLSQSIVNFSFGTVIWVGLYSIGIPSPGLWGVLAGLLRFIPYVGVLVAGVGPLALAAAVDPGWLMVGYVTLLFLIVEPLVGYVIEPLLYGHSTGLSPVSVVIAALFWTWIWGPLGLVLSMPLTLMLVVLGRHIPAFEIFDVVLGDRPALSPAQSFYQRVLAGHPEEAIELAEIQLETMTRTAYYDSVILCGLRLAVADLDRGAIARDALHAVGDATLEVLEALEDYPDPPTRNAELAPLEDPKARISTACADLNSSVLCVAGRGPLDPAVARMAAQLLRRAGCDVSEQVRPSGTANVLANIDASVICILGLFDERSFRRMQPVITNLKSAVSNASVLAGMTREQRADPTSHELLTSMESLCQAVSSTG